jgi:Rieske Fe-S protein
MEVSMAEGRRDFLGKLALAALGVTAAAGAAVAAIYSAGSALARGPRSAACAAIPPSPPAQPTLHTIELRTVSGWAEQVERRGAYVEALPDGSLRAFSATCPHSGCFVEWKAADDHYLCPCHVSTWSRDGERISGPAKRGLDPLPVSPGETGPQVCFKAFVPDSSERIEIG